MTAALTGIRVVDLSRVLAGPMCSQILADHGAAVVKVEPPSGDDTRTLGPPFNDSGDAAYFSALNRGKDCIVAKIALGHRAERTLYLLAQRLPVLDPERVVRKSGIGNEVWTFHDRTKSLELAAVHDP